jgi:hypothetical protein
LERSFSKSAALQSILSEQLRRDEDEDNDDSHGTTA